MFEIIWTDWEKMFARTQECFCEIEGIEKIITLQQELFETKEDVVCFGDTQIDGLEYPSSHDRLTVYLLERCKDEREVHYVLDFFEPEIHFFDIEFNTHWIDEVTIQKNPDNRYSISFGTGECDFRYSYAKVNRCWVQ